MLREEIRQSLLDKVKFDELQYVGINPNGNHMYNSQLCGAKGRVIAKKSDKIIEYVYYIGDHSIYGSIRF